MAIRIPRGKSDAIIDRIMESLRVYELDHAEARIDIYRQNPVSVRVRIIDPTFAGKTKVERSKNVWRYLDTLPDDVQSDLSTLTLLAPDEMRMSFANVEFDDPMSSRL